MGLGCSSLLAQSAAENLALLSMLNGCEETEANGSFFKCKNGEDDIRFQITRTIEVAHSLKSLP